MSVKSNSLSQLALQKFKKNFWGVFSLWIIILIGLLSVFAYLISPDNSQNANQMHLSIHSKKPGFKVTLLSIPSSQSNEQKWLDKVFFGVKNEITEIPISEYRIENEKLIYTEYTTDGLEGITKNLSQIGRGVF